MNKNQFYYENILAGQNVTIRPNVAWVADITTMVLEGYTPSLPVKKLHIFLCIDVHTNVVVAYKLSTETFTAKQAVEALKKAIDQRLHSAPKNKVIIHTDRGTQFSSSVYYKFTKEFSEYIMPSMSRQNTPTDNAVAERFMRTFKEHQINYRTMHTECQHMFRNKPSYKGYWAILRKYVNSLNNTPNLKTSQTSPERHDKSTTAASELMAEPLHLKARSERYGPDFRRDEVKHFSEQNSKVISILEEIAAKRAEVVNTTPFDHDDSLVLQVIDTRLQELYAIIQSNPETTQKYVKEALQYTEASLEELHRKMDILLPKKQKDRTTLPLRDPVTNDIFALVLNNAGSQAIYKSDIKRSQLRIAYTILYYTGLRLNEIVHLTKEDVIKATSASQFNIIHHKTKKAHVHVLSPQAVKDLKKRIIELDIICDVHKYKFIFGKKKPMNNSRFIQMVNEDLRATCELNNIPYNIKSHSFRINLISNLLKVTSVQNTADIIGHQDVRSTLAYKRYALSKNEIQDLLQKIQDSENN